MFKLPAWDLLVAFGITCNNDYDGPMRNFRLFLGKFTFAGGSC